MAKVKATIPGLLKAKKEGQKIRMVTAYDYPTAVIIDQTDIELILVGDSLGMVMLGYEGTVPVTMDEMIHHTKAVVRGARNTFIVGDLPFMSYNVSVEQAVTNAGRIMKEGGADCVKLEGGLDFADTVRAIVRAGIPVMGHIGLTPQTASALGGFKVQGKDMESARQIYEDALALEEAGAFALVLEAIPAPLAKIITEKLRIPTIGIGAGVHCDGQVLVLHDLLGLFNRFVPKFVKRYAKMDDSIREALNTYAAEVASQVFPGPEHSFSGNEDDLRKYLKV
ncbi:MAG: 3-methyl-2-oxobutanoate hydroxymethyltransferase [Bacillota bacterium]